ncbi:cation/H(+) antiporter 1-like [Triticum dicoccoides]|uniref:cation/H(+) antiporter 1-like n=1 Tax=Triticum dicoccoides TaxID=85692 RepID=UPI00188E6CE9|nr:cation/H(+) antiporter 1-like [Triticum dicoccoides]
MDRTVAFVKLIIFLFLSLNVWIAIGLVVWLVRLLNRAKKGLQYVSMSVLCVMLLFMVNTAQRLYLFGYIASMTAFLIGLATPREGPTARSLIDHLTYPVHQIIMPLCFGVTGAKLDFTKIGRFTANQLIIVVAFTTLLGTTGRVAGTVAAGRMIGIPARETLVLRLLLNVKGYVDILAINLGDKAGIWGDEAQSVVLLSSIINTLMAGPASAAIVRQQRRAFQYRSHCLQDLKLDQELRILLCVHGAGSVHAMLTLAEISKGNTPVAIYLLHLIELMTARKYAITHFYHPKGGADDDNGRWSHTREIHEVVAAVDHLTNDTIVAVRQMTAISSLVSMDADVCNGVEDTRASLVIVPFHKEQRYVRRMVCRRKGRRELNQRILQRAPCTEGVLVERHLGTITVAERQSTAEGNQSEAVDPEAEGSAPAHNVVALFLGGPDDREAVAYAARLAAHPSVSVTVSRFLPEGASMDATTEVRSMEEGMADEEFMADFYARFVKPGHVSCTERYVRNGVGMVESLWSMVGMYSLFIVGKGGGGGAAAAQMTKGMGGLNEECPELGPIGDFLSSDGLLGYGASVLVLRRHNVQKRTRGTQ